MTAKAETKLRWEQSGSAVEVEAGHEHDCLRGWLGY